MCKANDDSEFGLEDCESFELLGREKVIENQEGLSSFPAEDKIDLTTQVEKEMERLYNLSKDKAVKRLKFQNLIRYPNQPDLVNAKAELFYRQIKFRDLVDQESRERDNAFLNEYERERWSRQLRHPLINQRKISDARVSIFGVNCLGTSVLLSLTYTGVQNFIIADSENIEMSDLNCHTLFTLGDVGKTKVEAATNRLVAINPNIMVDSFLIKTENTFSADLSYLREVEYPTEIIEINEVIKKSDFVLCCTMNVNFAQILDYLCDKNQKSVYYIAFNNNNGNFYNHIPKQTPCLKCSNFYDGFEWSQSEIVSIPSETGSILSQSIVNDICEYGNPLQGNIVRINFSNYEIIKEDVETNSRCVCGESQNQ